MGDRFQIWAPAREASRREAAIAAAGDLLDIDAAEEGAP
jgi:hypothetical protein